MTKVRLLAILLGTAVAAAAGGAAAAADPPADGSPAARLHALFDREWRWRLVESPELATAVGVHDYDDRLSAESLADYARRDRETAAFLAELAAIGRAALPHPDQVDYDIFRSQLVERRDSYRFGEQDLQLNADSGFHTAFADLAQSHPHAAVRDLENYIARLRAFPRYMDEKIALLEEGLERGITPPRVTLAGVETTLDPLVVDDPEKSPLFRAFPAMSASIAAADRERLTRLGREAIATAVTPAYRKFRDFLLAKYLPGCRETLAASALPDGEAYYRFLIRQFTTLDRDAREIHELGLAEVARIRGEMEAVIAKTGFHGSFAEFLEFLRSDPRFYAKTPEELLKDAAWIAKRMDGKLPSLFRTLPRQPYGVEPVPDYLAPKYTAGRYSPSPKDSTEPGWYWVNTTALDTRPLYNLEALTLHESVPGHHLQGALAEEQEGLPNFRRYSYISAYGEGWGLYSEWLGIEAGFYTDPYSEFGRLTYQMWRACRLVVDTGVHAFGWTRQQMLDFLGTNTALSRHEIETETDRYISWPGQALSYYTGYLELRRLRAEAERELGARFDVRDFHDAVLRQGSVPLPVLDDEIRRYIALRKAAP